MSGMFGALWELEIVKMIGMTWTAISVMVILGIGLMTSTFHNRTGRML
jgi:hypothetical protein